MPALALDLPSQNGWRATERVLRFIVDEVVNHVLYYGLPIIADRDYGGYQLCTKPHVLVAEIKRLGSHKREIGYRGQALTDYLIRMGVSPHAFEDKSREQDSSDDE